jgi:hypothetical protein
MVKYLLLALCVFVSACFSTTYEKREELSYNIRVEFVFFQEDIEAYPSVLEDFVAACDTWSREINIEVVYFIEPSPLTLLSEQYYVHRKGIIRVRLVQMDDHFIHGNMFNGMWIKSNRFLWIDAADLQGTDQSYWTCLHELGHVFGLTHVAGKNDLNVVSGDIIVNDDPTNYVMYPFANTPTGLSPLEIKLVKNNMFETIKGNR